MLILPFRAPAPRGCGLVPPFFFEIQHFPVLKGFLWKSTFWEISTGGCMKQIISGRVCGLAVSRVPPPRHPAPALREGGGVGARVCS